MRHQLVRALFAALVFPACGSVAPDPIHALDQDFTIAVGTSVRISDADLVIRFEGVLSDSRCPADVQCISAGDATVLVTAATGGGAASRYELHTDAPPREATHDRVRIAVVSLKPVPISTRPTRAGDYVLTLRASRAPAA